MSRIIKSDQRSPEPPRKHLGDTPTGASGGSFSFAYLNGNRFQLHFKSNLRQTYFHSASDLVFGGLSKQGRNNMSTAALKSQASKDEADIRALLETIDKAHHNKDAAGIVAPYAQDAAVCDLAPPLCHRGMNLQAKQAWLDTWQGPIGRETHAFHLFVGGVLTVLH